MSQHKYIIIADQIRNGIQNNIYKPGERLPSERELSEKFKVSRMTLRQGIRLLEDDGLVSSERGSGTYVCIHGVAQNNVNSFTESVQRQGYIPKTKVLEISTIYSIPKIARELEVSADMSFFKLKRLRMGDKIPMALETLYIPKCYCPDLDQYNLEGSLYDLLEKVFSIRVEKGAYDVEAIISNPILAEIFEVKKATALLKVSGITIDQNERKIMYETSIYRSDLYKYHIDINRKK